MTRNVKKVPPKQTPVKATTGCCEMPNCKKDKYKKNKCKEHYLLDKRNKFLNIPWF